MNEFKDLMNWIPKEFRADCETYVRTMERLEKLGVKTDKEAVICLARELDFYRDKLMNLEEQTMARKRRNERYAERGNGTSCADTGKDSAEYAGQNLFHQACGGWICHDIF